MASRFKDSSGEVIHHFLFVSSFSGYTVVDIAHLVKISPEIPVDKAALLSCGVSTGSFFFSSFSRVGIEILIISGVKT
jgi:S-(hydroxymethyl)glutathione dehydrogenase/alcohol dehydrogenase